MHDRTRVSCGVSDVLAVLGPTRPRPSSVTLCCFALNSHLQYPLSCLAPRNPMIPVPWTSVVQGQKGSSGRPAETRRAYSATCAAPLSLPASRSWRECRVTGSTASPARGRVRLHPVMSMRTMTASGCKVAVACQPHACLSFAQCISPLQAPNQLFASNLPRPC